MNDPGIRSLSVGSVSGFASARSVAELYNRAILVGADSTSPHLSENTWLHMFQHFPTVEHGSFLKTIGLANNWTMTAAGQIRNSPKVSYDSNAILCSVQLVKNPNPLYISSLVNKSVHLLITGAILIINLAIYLTHWSRHWLQVGFSSPSI